MYICVCRGRARSRPRAFSGQGPTSFSVSVCLSVARLLEHRRRRRNSLVKGCAAVRDPEPLVWGWRARRAIGRLTVVRGSPDRAKCSCQGPSAAKGPVEGIVAVRVARQQCTPLRVRGGRNFFSGKITRERTVPYKWGLSVGTRTRAGWARKDVTTGGKLSLIHI